MAGLRRRREHSATATAPDARLVRRGTDPHSTLRNSVPGTVPESATLPVGRGLVRSLRGPKGGYILAKPPGEIKLSDIFRTLEGPLIAVECLSHPEFCPRCADCVTRKIWSKIQNTMVDLLESLTLQDLVDMSEGKKVID